MSNNNNNGVTVRLREKAEKILLNKYEKAVKVIRERRKKLKEKAKKGALAQLGIDKLIMKFKSLREECDRLEEEIHDKAGHGLSYYSSSDIERGEILGDKIEKKVEERMKSEINLSEELKRLDNLKDQLLGEVWLAGQPDDVKDILSKMM